MPRSEKTQQMEARNKKKRGRRGAGEERMAKFRAAGRQSDRNERMDRRTGPSFRFPSRIHCRGCEQRILGAEVAAAGGYVGMNQENRG